MVNLEFRAGMRAEFPAIIRRLRLLGYYTAGMRQRQFSTLPFQSYQYHHLIIRLRWRLVTSAIMQHYALCRCDVF